MMATMPATAWGSARLAAGRIVGGPAPASVVRAVLAQWVAENGWRWPPPRNNPGNNAERWAKALGCRFTVETPNPQPSNPIVSYPTLAAGVDCYADGLVAFTRYDPAVARAKAGDGLGFLVLVCRAGYGTGEANARSVYADLGNPPAAGPAPSTGGPNVAIRYSPVTATKNLFEVRAGTRFYDRPGGRAVTSVSVAKRLPHVGLAGSVGGEAWRAVVKSTRWSYTDGAGHATVLYVPASSGKVVST